MCRAARTAGSVVPSLPTYMSGKPPILRRVSWPTKLPRWADRETAWVAVVLVAAGWSAVMGAAVNESMESQRTLTFTGGPLLLVAGIHARMSDFLHAPQRSRLLPLPLPPVIHWRDAIRHHRVGLLGTWVAGAIALGSLSFAVVAPPPEHYANVAKLVLDWTWLCALAMGVEPLFAGLAAYLGRRFPEGHAGQGIQHSAGGGWTQNEAVVHLYAPALAIGTAAALAMPGQLVFMGWDTYGELPAVAGLAAIVPLGLSLVLPRVGRNLYVSGVWEAVPWLTEATRTLAGPALPEPTPSWVASLKNPVRRVLVLQLLRATPMPMFRLVAPLLWAGAVLFWQIPLGAPVVAVGLGLAALWIMPLRILTRQRLARARTFVALPLPEPQRRGRDPLAPVLAALPLALALGLALVQWTVRT